MADNNARHGGTSPENVTIDKEDWKVDRGDGYAASVNLGAVAGDGGVANLSFTTNSEKPHLTRYVLVPTAGPGTFVLYEDADVTGGTSIDARALNRSGTVDPPTVTINEGATVNSTGTQLEIARVSGDKESGSRVEGSVNKWVLAADTTYLMQYTNNSTEDSNAVFDMVWFEEHN